MTATTPHTARSRLLSQLLIGILLIFAIGLPSPLVAQDLLNGNRSTSTNLLGGTGDFLPVTEAFQLQPLIYEGQLILHWEIAPEYYMYRERFRVLPRGGELPAPEYTGRGVNIYDEYFERDMEVFYGSATLTLDLTEISGPFALRVDSQGCADAGLCYPPHSDYLWVDPVAGSIDRMPAEDFLGGASGTVPTATPWLPYVLLLALLGGIILNLMPCVFPVLSIKVMSLARADRARLPLHGWAYTAGIVSCFALFGIALLAARAGGEAIGWGFQLQSPALIAALAYLFFILGLSLSGLISIGTRWMGTGQALTEKTGLGGSYFTGVLAAVVASPCTAPFMGAALGFALTQPALVSLSVFVALGLGMALPLLLLCYVPALARRLPRPGHWMETLKQALAFPLYLTAVWLLWVLGRQAGSDAIIAVCTGAVAIAFGCWLAGRSTRTAAGHGVRWVAVIAAWVIAIVLPLQLLNQPVEESRWQAYTPERLQQLRAEGRPVFINLTADWCITCLANERVTLGTDEITRAFDRHGVATLKGDWTNREPQITRLLEDYGRSGVPLYLWFPAGHQGPGEILPQILTRSRILEALSSQKTAE